MDQILFEGVPVEVVRSRRRSVGLEIKGDGRVILRLPNRFPKREAMAFLESRKGWLQKHLAEVREQEAAAEVLGQEPLTAEELTALTKAARAYFEAACARFAPLVGVDYGRISIRHQKTRWGSCSSKGNLNFNCLLMLAPEEVREYVVVHELCHRKHMDHSAAFWAEVEKVIPEYREMEQWLKREGASLQRRLPKTPPA